MLCWSVVWQYSKSLLATRMLLFALILCTFEKIRTHTHSQKNECRCRQCMDSMQGLVHVLNDRGKISEFQTSCDRNKIRKLKFPGERLISQTSWGCLESVYASFCSSWTLNLRFRSWRPDQNRQAICHGLGRLVLTERRGRWVCVGVCLHSCLLSSLVGEVMCWVLRIQ